MAIHERARARIELDGSQAEQQLQALRTKASAMRQELERMRLARDPGYAAKQREFKNLNNKIRQLSRSSFDLNGTLRNLSGASMRDLTRAQSVLTAQIRQTNRATAEGRASFAQKTEQLRRVRTEMASVRGQMMGMNSNMNLLQRATQGFNRYFGMVAATVGTFTAAIMGLRSTVNVFNEFEASVAELSAITGLAGEELDWMAERAMDASTSMTEAGVRFTNSAQEIVEAYTMVGSKRPELLQNRQALAEVTEAAMTLSSAARIDLEPAATALTTVMNQFGSSAEEASSIINVLGAGSKVGAANVAYLNRVIERSGTAAVSANLSIEELVGVVEGVAPRFSQPAEAATSLRNVLLRLQGMDDELNPAIVGIEQALENLADRGYSTSELMEMFGMRAINMVQAMIDGREDIARYTQAVTDTDVALEQAAINSDTNAAALEQARNRAQLLRIEMGEKLAPAMTFSTNAFSYFLRILKTVIENWDTYRQLIYASVAVWAAYNQAMIRARVVTLATSAATKAQTALLATKNTLLATARVATLAYAAAQARLTGNVQRATAAMRALRVAMAATPWGAVAAGITAIASAIVIWRRNKDELTESEKAHHRVQERTNEQFSEQSARVLALQQIVENGNLPLQRRKEALEELQKIVPDYNASLTEEGELINANTDAIGAYLDKLREKIRFDAFKNEITGVLEKQEQASRKIIDTEAELQQAKQDTRDIVSRLLERGIDEDKVYNVSAVRHAQRREERIREEIRETQEVYNSHQQTIDELTQSQERYSEALNENSEEAYDLANAMQLVEEANKITEMSVDALEEKLSLYSAALNNVEEGSQEYNEIKKLMARTQEQLNELVDKGNQNLEEAKNKYQELTSAISEAQSQLRHLVAIGDFDAAKATGHIIKNLEANKLVMDGIIEHGGEVEAFLDSMADSTEARMEETVQMNEWFLEEFKDSSDEWEEIQQERREREIEREKEERQRQLDEQDQDMQRRLELWEEERDRRIEYEQQIQDAKRQIIDASLGHIWQLQAAHMNAEFDRRLNALQKAMETELANENLTSEERQAIREKYQRKEAQVKQEHARRQRQADIIQSVINTSIAVSRALSAPPGFPLNAASVALVGVLGAMETAAIAAQPIPQFARGKYYTVQGEDDGRTYTAPWIGVPQTGLYTSPALFAEQGEEIIIDSPTTKNLKINHPEIIEGIMANRVTQYASGSYPYQKPKTKQYAEGNLPDHGESQRQTGENIIQPQDLTKLQKSIDNLHEVSQALLDEGVRGVWVYSDLMRLKTKAEKMEQETKL